jgi:hypothetical protein
MARALHSQELATRNQVESPPANSDAAARFLADTLLTQTGNVMRYVISLQAGAGEKAATQIVWLKKAGPPNPPWRYRALGALAAALRLELLRPVPNPGGSAAIAQEAERLRTLSALGLRTPTVLAVQDDGLLLADLGASHPGPDRLAPGPTLSVADLLERSQGLDAEAVLGIWQKGLASLTRVHSAGTYLSQAFARNLIWCPDGVIGYIDFEDDPGQVLDVAQCQARDWLCYVHSTALALENPGTLAQAVPLWRAALQTASPDVQRAMAQAAGRLAWMQRLPRHRRWGRDMRRLRAAAALLAAPH